ncbi:MAG: transporter substrate-binding domain-containing protein [Anaerolineae bacterium]
MRRLLLSLSLVLLLVGCADLVELLPEDEVTEMPDIYTAPTPRPFPPETSTARRIQERGVLLVGVRYDLEPFSYVTAEGQLSGLEIDLARALAERWLGDPEAVRFRQVRSDTAFHHLQAGNVDIVLAGIIHTQEAESEVDFGPPYFMDGEALLTFPQTGITSLENLGAYKIGGLRWTESRTALQAASPVTITYVPYDNFSQLLEGLRTRQIDVYADRRRRLERARRAVAGTQIVAQYTQLPVALVHLENDPFFADLVTMTFREMAADGTRAALYARWLPDTSPPKLIDWPASRPTPSLSEAPQTRSTRNTLEQIRERGGLRVGYFPNRWPYSADRGDGVQTGFEVRLLELMAERWLGSRQAVTYVPVTEPTAFRQLQSGDLDLLLGGWIHTEEAETTVAFSLTLVDDGVSLLSMQGTPVETLEALGGRPVGVIAGTAGEAAVPQITEATGIGLNTVTYADRAAAVAGLQTGEVVALLAERWILLDPFYRVGGFFLPDTRLTFRPVAYVLPRGDSDFRDFVNLTLAALHADGSFAELYRIWFDDPIPELPPWPGHPLAPLTLQK